MSAPDGDQTTAPPVEGPYLTCPHCGKDNPVPSTFCAGCFRRFGLEPPVAGPDSGTGSPHPQTRQARPASDPLAAPSGLVRTDYAGFWIRLGALLIDGVLLFAFQLAASLFKAPDWVPVVANLAYFVLFTGIRGQTPGKMVCGIQVVNAYEEVPGIWRALLRETFGKWVSAIFLLGFLWVAWDGEKRGWHDFIGGTFVVRK